MLQQQQAVLQKLLDSQKTLETNQKAFEETVESLKLKVNVSSQNTTPSSSGSDERGKQKRMVTRSLLVGEICLYIYIYI